ncbi:MAG TPA: sirohydrochlorin chelatase [Candidatus Avamphibacillus intestinigallinarum]|nr:sirohydrochlorin chelatase [Candidatus Avamphibacillus intestinigallinarum]
MEAVLYIGHGSRVKAGVQEAIEFIEKAKKSIDVPIQEICFLELADPDIRTGVERCVKRGATTISIVPILLLTAVHAKFDIPEAIEEVKKAFPSIYFKYGRPFGVHEKINAALLDRVLEKVPSPKQDAAVLLIGRGSSDPDVKRDLTNVAKSLESLHTFQCVETCFMYGATPHFEEGLEHMLKTQHKQIFVIPYLLFQGILMNEISERIECIEDEEKEVILCDSLGYHINLVDVLKERTIELVESSLMIG